MRKGVWNAGEGGYRGGFAWRTAARGQVGCETRDGGERTRRRERERERERGRGRKSGRVRKRRRKKEECA